MIGCLIYCYFVCLLHCFSVSGTNIETRAVMFPVAVVLCCDVAMVLYTCQVSPSHPGT